MSVVIDSFRFVTAGGGGSPPVVESTTFTDITAGESAGVTGPSACNVDDLLVMVYLCDETQTVATGSTTGSPGTIPSGWTEIEAGVAKTAGGDCSIYAFYKVAVSGDTSGLPQTYSWAWNSGADGCALMFRISNVDTTTPIADTSTDNTGSGQTSIVLSSVTTSADDSLLLAAFGVDESSSTYAPYWADPPITGWTARYGSSSVPNTLGTSATYIGACSTTQATAGASGTKTATIDAQNDAIAGFLIAISPP